MSIEPTGSAFHLPQDDLVVELEALEEVHGKDLFARGFLVTNRPVHFRPSSWLTRVFQGLNVYHDKRLPATVIEDEDRAVCLLGDAFDLRWPTHTNTEVAERLLAQVRLSRAAFLAETDHLNGRFLILFSRGTDEIEVLNDATGMRAVFHNEDASLLASHASLAAANLGSHLIDQNRVRARFGFPGRRTPYPGILLLIPNHSLVIEEGNLSRFYPREPLSEMTSEEVADAVLGDLQAASIAVVTRIPRVIASLTAGTDSRTTLAVSRALVDRVHFFTYYREPDADTDLADRIVSERLARRHGLHHTVLDVGPAADSNVPSEFLHLCQQHSYYRHFPRGAYAYSKRFKNEADMHIRSNVSEIGRAFYLKTKNVAAPLQTPNDLADAYMTFARKNNTSELRRNVVDDFEDFYDAGSFSEVEDLRDTRDMLYWEHRMGAWHSLAVLESDPMFDSTSVFNSRRVLDLLLAVPLEDRAQSQHLRLIIERCWPALLEEPFNPKNPLAIGSD